jgi:hypothetical protein
MINHTESTVIVYKTKDYKLFKHLKGNRNLNLGKVKKIKKAILEGLDMLKYNPILVSETENDKLEIIDGQHRFEVCKELNSQVWYIVCTQRTLSEVALLNSNTENWKTADFINCFASAGNDNYKKLAHINATYKYSISQILPMLHTGEMKTNGGLGQSLKEQFKNGTLKINHYDATIAMCDELNTYAGAFKQFASGAFVEAITRVQNAKKIDYQKFKAKLIENAPLVPFCNKPLDYLNAFEIVYNKGNAKRMVIY